MSKIIVITGAGAGLGKSLAQRFAADGDTVILLGRTLSKVQAVAAALGDCAMAVECDVASAESVRAAFARIAERFPKIDVLINNAAVFEPAAVAEASDAHILDTININLIGAIFCARAAIPMLGAGGHIINVSSESIDVPFWRLTLYQTSKAGLEQFSRMLQRELEPSGVRVTIIRAGQMMEQGKETGWDPEAARRFHMANLEGGLDIRKRPISQFQSVTGIFRSVIDLPPDVHVGNVQVHARSAG